MELLFNLLPIEVVSAAPVIKSSLFSTITIAANTFVSIIKWAALLYLLVKITILGFNIVTEAKNSSDAVNKIKDQGTALLIGFFIVMTSFMIHKTLEDTVNSIGKTGQDATSGNTIGYNDSTDVFKNVE